MATSVDLAKREQPAAPAAAAPRAPISAPGTAPAPGLNPQDWINANRIHIKDGSLFIDPYLVLHPRELAPQNDEGLRKKLQLTYTINNPSFFESSARTTIALNLGQLIPTSPNAKRSKLMAEIQQLNANGTNPVDVDLKREIDDKHAPMAAIARSVAEHPEADPVGMEALKNSLAVYLLIREKLTKNGYLDKLTDYVKRTGSTDQILADLTSKIGVTPLAMHEAGLKGGLDGIGKLLGLEPKYVSDVKELTNLAATQDFSYNLVEHWHIGRQRQGLQAPLAEKILTGLDGRITAKINEYRDRLRHHFEVPLPVQEQEKNIAAALLKVEPIQRELMYRLGYEICYSPEINADDIAFFPGIYGLHRKAANDLRDAVGTYRIYFSGRGSLEDSMRTLVHEVAHNLWPEQFKPDEINKIDQLAQSDHFRFMRFHTMMQLHYGEFEKLFNAYAAGNEKEKAAVIAATNERFKQYDFHAEGLFPYINNAQTFQFAVDHAYTTLSIEGERYNRSNYNTPEERFREVISRFAELEQVKYKGEPQFLQFLAPGLSQIWHAHYLPHLGRVNEALKAGTLAATRPAAQKDETPSTETTPKVEERPGTPVSTTAPQPPTATPGHVTPTGSTPIGINAAISDSAPLTSINVSSVNTLAARAVLNSMGIVPH